MNIFEQLDEILKSINENNNQDDTVTIKLPPINPDMETADQGMEKALEKIAMYFYKLSMEGGGSGPQIDNNIDLTIKQSNHEGDLIDFIQSCYFDKFDGIIINPGAYTHTSIGILDALKSVNLPTIEVHISDITKREEFRKNSYISLAATKTILGMGIDGYFIALKEFIK